MATQVGPLCDPDDAGAVKGGVYVAVCSGFAGDKGEPSVRGEWKRRWTVFTIWTIWRLRRGGVVSGGFFGVA